MKFDSNFNNFRLLTYRELLSVELGENNEPLVHIPSELRAQQVEFPLLRRGVINRLLQVEKHLRSHNKFYTIEIFSAYRTLELQQRMFEQVLRDLRAEKEFLSELELFEAAHKFVAVPDVAPHPTGGAVDLSLFNEQTHCLLDMGTEYKDFSSAKLPVRAPGLTQAQHENRMLLRKCMMSAGFAPFNGEWWHFSYGDREWAAFYGEKHSIYAPLVDEL